LRSKLEGVVKELARTIPQSATLSVFDPGRNYKLLPALAKNMPQAYFLYASRPLHKGAFDVLAFRLYSLYKMQEDPGE